MEVKCPKCESEEIKHYQAEADKDRYSCLNCAETFVVRHKKKKKADKEIEVDADEEE